MRLEESVTADVSRGVPSAFAAQFEPLVDGKLKQMIQLNEHSSSHADEAIPTFKLDLWSEKMLA